MARGQRPVHGEAVRLPYERLVQVLRDPGETKWIVQPELRVPDPAAFAARFGVTLLSLLLTSSRTELTGAALSFAFLAVVYGATGGVSIGALFLGGAFFAHRPGRPHQSVVPVALPGVPDGLDQAGEADRAGLAPGRVARRPSHRRDGREEDQPGPAATAARRRSTESAGATRSAGVSTTLRGISAALGRVAATLLGRVAASLLRGVTAALLRRVAAGGAVRRLGWRSSATVGRNFGGWLLAGLTGLGELVAHADQPRRCGGGR